MKKGVALFAHGSRDPRWKAPFVELEKRLSDRAPCDLTVKTAFLQDCEPNLFDVIGAMAKDGCAKITIVPMFLAVGAHAAKDFPEIAQKLRNSYADISFEWTEVIGQWDETQNALASVLADKLSD
ncbi:hypothetical protein MNBD_NITROSPINAE04-447 [hydrothermal vent metagenome]|uniref:Sirohydrochlorin cobaltochelatase n=1 Tax=hydrothermal vent metagenome TaxID=652676 RepID=A0A3B1CCJ1_9ZZZZ